MKLLPAALVEQPAVGHEMDHEASMRMTGDARSSFQ
jgi:hypothetical protein